MFSFQVVPVEAVLISLTLHFLLLRREVYVTVGNYNVSERNVIPCSERICSCYLFEFVSVHFLYISVCIYSKLAT